MRFALLLAFVACGSSSDAHDAKSADADGAIDARALTSLGPFRGAVLTSWQTDGYSELNLKNVLDALETSDVETVAVLVTWYQTSATSTAIGPRQAKTPSDEGVIRAINAIHARGMRAVLKPHVDIGDDTWRGEIAMGSESDWADWWQDYQAFITHYAAIAEQHNVELFIVGTELKKTVSRPEWRDTIAAVRSEYNGPLTYAANWDNVAVVPFWDAVDYIGIDIYWPVSSSPEPTKQQLISAHHSRLDTLEQLSLQQGRPVLVTEFGYQDRDGTTITPWWSDGSSDPAEQALAYEALLEALQTREWIHGCFAWMAYHDPWANVDGFDFIGKPAQTALQSAYQQMAPQ